MEGPAPVTCSSSRTGWTGGLQRRERPPRDAALPDGGRAGLDERFAAAWQAFSPVVEGWVDVELHTGPAALEQLWLEVQSGHTAPRAGQVVTFPRGDTDTTA